MVTAIDYLEDVTNVADDITSIKGFSSDLGLGLSAAEAVLELPGNLEEQLRRGEALDLPSVIVTPLSFVPYIGTAIKTLDNIAEETVEVIDQQADIMGALDASWAVPRNLVSGADAVNTVIANTLSALSVEHQSREQEAQLLVASIGGQEILESSGLAAKLNGYGSVADAWFNTRDAILAPLEAAMAGLNNVTASLENALAVIAPVEDIMDDIFDLFDPIVDAMEDIEDALCVVFTITPEIVVPKVVITPAIWVPPVVVLGVTITPGFWIPEVAIPGYTIPAVTVDICAILEFLDDQLSIVQDFVIDTINGLLSLLGFDLLGAIDDLIDVILGPLDPIFDAIDAIEAATQTIIDSLAATIQSVEDAFDSVIAQLEDLINYSSLFENQIEGDQLANVDDTLVGTEDEDGVFGLSGDDILSGEGGDDFLFGGDGDDEMSGGAGNDEAYGGIGADTLKGEFGDDLLDGGEGKDLMLGGGGADIMIGGEDTDILLGGGGADEIYFNTGDGVDLIIGFEDDIDTLNIDADLVGSATTGQQVVDQYGVSFGSITILDFGDEKLVFLGVTDPDSLANDINLI